MMRIKNTSQLPARIDNLNSYFEDIFRTNDPWHLATSDYEKRKYQQQIELISAYSKPKNILELGSAEGIFTRIALESLAANITSVEISASAIERARQLLLGANPKVELVNRDSIEYILETTRKWDVLVWSESIHYSCRSRTLAEVIEVSQALGSLLNSGGVLCMTNTIKKSSQIEDYDSTLLFSTVFHLISSQLNCVHKSTHNNFKNEDQAFWEYENWVFKKVNN